MWKLIKSCLYIISPGVLTIDSVNKWATHCHTFIEIKGANLLNYKENKLSEIKSTNAIPRSCYTLSFVVDGMENWKGMTSIEQGRHNFMGGVIKGNYPKQIWFIVRIDWIYTMLFFHPYLYIFMSFQDSMELLWLLALTEKSYQSYFSNFQVL